jgi:hypothetical protein
MTTETSPGPRVIRGTHRNTSTIRPRCLRQPAVCDLLVPSPGGSRVCGRERRPVQSVTAPGPDPPPMTEPLYTTFTGPPFRSNTKDLLHGVFDCLAAPTAASRRFLEHCRYPALVTTRLSSDITIDNRASFWRQMPEKKASEPHGLHNGHFKAAVQSKLLLTCDAAAHAIPYKTGYAPRQWRNLMNFAIEKKPGELRVDLMRMIELMNTEANTNNKKVGRDVMRQAESHKMIPPGQSGSRKAHCAANLTLCKRLVWDLLILLCLAAGWCSNVLLRPNCSLGGHCLPSSLWVALEPDPILVQNLTESDPPRPHRLQ